MDLNRNTSQAGELEPASADLARPARPEPDWAEAEAVLELMIGEAGGLSDEVRVWARSALGISGTEAEGEAEDAPGLAAAGG